MALLTQYHTIRLRRSQIFNVKSCASTKQTRLWNAGVSQADSKTDAAVRNCCVQGMSKANCPKSKSNLNVLSWNMESGNICAARLQRPCFKHRILYKASVRAKIVSGSQKHRPRPLSKLPWQEKQPFHRKNKSGNGLIGGTCLLMDRLRKRRRGVKEDEVSL